MTGLTARKSFFYATRRLKAGDYFTAPEKNARVLIAAGLANSAVLAHKEVNVPPHNEVTMLRAEYERVSGRRAFMGWDADKLREKIAASQAKG